MVARNARMGRCDVALGCADGKDEKGEVGEISVSTRAGRAALHSVPILPARLQKGTRSGAAVAGARMLHVPSSGRPPWG